MERTEFRPLYILQSEKKFHQPSHSLTFTELVWIIYANLIFIIYFKFHTKYNTSHVYIKILSTFTEQKQYIVTTD